MRLVLTMGLLCLLCVSQLILPCTAQPEQDFKPTTIPATPGTDGTEDDNEDFLNVFIQNIHNVIRGVPRFVTHSEPSDDGVQLSSGDDNTESFPAFSFFKYFHFNDDESASSEKPEPQQSSLPFVRLTIHHLESPSNFLEPVQIESLLDNERHVSVEHEDSVVIHEISPDQVSDEELQKMFLGQQILPSPENSVVSTDMNQTTITSWPPMSPPMVDPLFAISKPMLESSGPAPWAHHIGHHRRFRAWHLMPQQPLALIGLGAIVMAGFIGAITLLVSVIRRRSHPTNYQYQSLKTIPMARQV